MSRAIIAKTLRDATLLLLVVAAGILLFDVLAVRVLVEASRDLEFLRTWLERPLVKLLMRSVLGADLGSDLNTTALATFLLAHPMYFGLCWVALLTLGSGVVAGEIGRGTADLLLTLPVSRGTVYRSVTIVLLLAAALISFLPIVGLWLGQRVFPLREPLQLDRLSLLTVNIFALNVSIAGVTLCVSTLVSRRGLAVGWVLAALLASDLLDLLAQFWEAARSVAALGLLHYYQPLPVVRDGTLPWDDFGVLIGVATAAWVGGLLWFTRRDIPAA